MIDTILHAGSGHMNLWVILIPGLAAFVAGLGLGWWSRRRGPGDADQAAKTTDVTDESREFEGN